MRALLTCILSAFIVSIAASSSARASKDVPVSVFRKLVQFYEDLRAERLDAAMALYATDAQVILPSQAPVVGVNAIRTWWAALLGEFEFNVLPELIEAVDLGDGVLLRGRAVGFLLSRQDKSATPVDIWFMQVYRRQPDGAYLFWRGASGANPAQKLELQIPSHAMSNTAVQPTRPVDALRTAYCTSPTFWTESFSGESYVMRSLRTDIGV